MKKLTFLFLFLGIVFSSSAQFFYSDYTVTNTSFDCDYIVTFYQFGSYGSNLCKTTNTQTIQPGNSYTWLAGYSSCNISSIYFSVIGSGGTVQHTNLLNNSYNGPGGCNGYQTTFWAPITGNSFKLWSDISTGTGRN